MGHVEGQKHHTLLAPDGTGSGSYGNHQEHLLSPFQELAEQQQTSPEIFELVSVLYDAYTVQRQLETAAHRQPEQPLHERPVSSAIERYGSSLPIDPPVSERLTRASRFVEAAVHIMRGSFTTYPDDPVYLHATINAAYAPYGFQIAEGRGEITVESSLYHDRIEQQIQQYALSRKEQIIPYETLHFQIDDAYQWESVGIWEEDPEVALLTEHMNHVRRVDVRLRELKQSSWFRSSRRKEQEEHVPGLHPYYRERYSQAQGFLEKTAEGVMRDGMGSDSSVYLGGYGWLHALAYTVNESFYDLDMHIDVNPTWTPEQPSALLTEDTPGRITKIEEI